MKKEQNKLISNGVYSVMTNAWIKEPVKEDIPEIDKEAFDKEFKVWEDRYNEIINNSKEKLNEKTIIIHPTDDLLDQDDAQFLDKDEIHSRAEEVVDFKDKKPLDYDDIFQDTVKQTSYKELPNERIPDYSRKDIENNLKYLDSFKEKLDESNSFGDFIGSMLNADQFAMLDTYCKEYFNNNISKGLGAYNEKNYKYYKQRLLKKLAEINELTDKDRVLTWPELQSKYLARYGIISALRKKDTQPYEVFYKLLQADRTETWFLPSPESLHEELKEDYIAYETMNDLEKAFKAYQDCKNKEQKAELLKAVDIALYQTYTKDGIDKNRWNEIHKIINNAKLDKNINESDLTRFNNVMNLLDSLNESSIIRKEITLPNNKILSYGYGDNSWYVAQYYQLNGEPGPRVDFRRSYGTEEAAKKAFDKLAAVDDSLNEDIQIKNDKEFFDLVSKSEINNSRFNIDQFKKNEGRNDGFYCLIENNKLLAAACVFKNRAGINDLYINEVQTLQKGFGKKLLEELFKLYDKVWLMAEPGNEQLVSYYRQFGLKEYKLSADKSTYNVDTYFFSNFKDEKLIDFINSYYNKDILDKEAVPKEEINEDIQNDQLDAIAKYINDIYELRKTSLATEGEYGIGNLVFKEVRNKGYLDNLKELKNKIISKELSLESLAEDSADIKKFEDKINTDTSQLEETANSKSTTNMLKQQSAKKQEIKKIAINLSKAIKPTRTKEGKLVCPDSWEGEWR